MCVCCLHNAWSGKDSKYVVSLHAVLVENCLIRDLLSQVTDLNSYSQDINDHDQSLKAALQCLKSEKGNLKQKAISLENVNGDYRN